MNLKLYLKAIGDEECARLYGVKRRTARSWREGTRVPRVRVGLKIIKTTKHRVRFEDIYGERE